MRAHMPHLLSTEALAAGLGWLVGIGSCGLP